MADFMTNFDNQRQAYLEHYGVKGMRWGVINEKETSNQETKRKSTPVDAKLARRIHRADKKTIGLTSKKIRRQMIVGLSTMAILIGISVAVPIAANNIVDKYYDYKKAHRMYNPYMGSYVNYKRDGTVKMDPINMEAFGLHKRNKMEAILHKIDSAFKNYSNVKKTNKSEQMSLIPIYKK